MSRPGKQKPTRKKQHRPQDSGLRAGRRERTAHGQGRIAAERSARWSWFADKRPILRFVLVFGLLLAGFNAFFYFWFSRADAFDSYLGFNARCSAFVLSIFGDSATVNGTSIIGSRYSLDIKRGCDAIQASAFFVLGVLASPAPVSLLSRIVPLAIGTLFLLVMNLVRIVSLYYTGVYYPKAFDVLHVDVWQALFIFLPLFLWVIWARWAGRSQPVSADVSG